MKTPKLLENYTIADLTAWMENYEEVWGAAYDIPIARYQDPDCPTYSYASDGRREVPSKLWRLLDDTRLEVLKAIDELSPTMQAHIHSLFIDRLPHPKIKQVYKGRHEEFEQRALRVLFDRLVERGSIRKRKEAKEESEQAACK
jgi:hypothetical protein